jgi:hypothetical protein
MEDLKQIQEFFSKPVKENSRRSPDFILTEPAEIKYTESFGSGIKAPGVLHHANEGVFLGAEGAYIIVLPGGTFYVDEDKEEAIRIYPLKDQSRELQLALDYTPFSPKYETWKSWVKEPKTLDEADLNDPVAMKMRAAKMKADKLAKMRAANAGDDGNDKFFDAAKLRALKKKRAQIMRDMEQEAEMEGGPIADKYGDMLNKIDKAIAMLSEYNTGLYYDPTKERNAVKAKDAAKPGIERVKDMLKKIMSEEEGYSKYLKTDDNPEGKTKGLDTKTMNKILMNVIKDLDETIKLGKNLNEELCAKGKAYRKKRMAAGEKSSAYLSGRAVKVCKGQMKG